jgi:hypothetical protein
LSSLGPNFSPIVDEYNKRCKSSVSPVRVRS